LGRNVVIDRDADLAASVNYTERRNEDGTRERHLYYPEQRSLGLVTATKKDNKEAPVNSKNELSGIQNAIMWGT
jgi:hypothetical protein